MLSYLCIFILLIVLELFYFHLADHFNIIDKPNLRSSHTHITLRGGGVIFYLGILLYSAFFGVQYGWFLVGLTLISVISFIDDVHSVSNRSRIAVHFLAMFLMFYQWNILNKEFFWYIIPALILCTGIINAYNFMDGINGITGGYSLVILFSLFLINQQTLFIDSNLLITCVLSLIVFCFFNFRKRAKCFAGDVGSVSIAFIILFILGKLILSTGNYSYLLFLAVYGVDTLLTICHRLMLHENIFEAHRKHVYQLLANELKIPHVVVSLIYMGIQLIVSLGIIYSPVNGWLYAIVVLALLMLLYFLIIRKYYHLHEEYLIQKQITL
jgi:UDP-N-acetylmuramyl pentapeptide phosphotransferase/UDP-N-acetylglucosamine-1-phosphate transferase